MTDIRDLTPGHVYTLEYLRHYTCSQVELAQQIRRAAEIAGLGIKLGTDGYRAVKLMVIGPLPAPLSTEPVLAAAV